MQRDNESHNIFHCIVGSAYGSDISYESINAQEFSTDDSRSSFDTQASCNYPTRKPSSTNMLPPANSPHDYRNDGDMEFDFLCQQAMNTLDSIPAELTDGFSGVDDENIVRNLRKTSGNLLTDALNMALEEASQFVMEQNTDVKPQGQDYNLVELAPWDNSVTEKFNAYRGTSPGYQTDTSGNPNTSLDDTMSTDGMIKEIRNAQHQGLPQQGLNNVQYEISSATNLLYGSDQHAYEQHVQDAYMNQQYTDNVLRNQLQNVTTLPQHPAGSSNMQNVQQTQWPNATSNFALPHGIGTSKPECISTIASQGTSQMLAGNQIVGCSGIAAAAGDVQDVERSFLEEMASIDILPPIKAPQIQQTGGTNPLSEHSMNVTTGSNATATMATLSSNAPFTPQPSVLSNSPSSTAPVRQGNQVVAGANATLRNALFESGNIPYTPVLTAPGFGLGSTPMPTNVNSALASNSYESGSLTPVNMPSHNVSAYGDNAFGQPNYGSPKGNRQCPGCQQFFNHARNKYCDKCHENCAKTPKNCTKCNQLFTSSNICRKFCDNCQKKPTTKSEELKRNCSNCNQEFLTANSCRKYCDNCKTKPKEATTTKCATCNSDFIRSKQLRKYCAACQTKDKGEIQRKCLQCENIFSDSNLNRKSCYTCRKQNSVSNNLFTPLSAPKQNENRVQSESARLPHLQYMSVKEHLAKSIIGREGYVPAPKDADSNAQTKSEHAVNCSQCGTKFVSPDLSVKLCGFCIASVSNSTATGTKTSQCTNCKQMFFSAVDGKTQCDACTMQAPVKCVDCQKEFLPTATNFNRCVQCCTKGNKPKVYLRCEKCSSLENEGKRLCGNCQEPKKKQNVPRKCEGCEAMISHTPRKFCDTCRENNEKPQVMGNTK